MKSYSIDTGTICIAEEILAEKAAKKTATPTSPDEGEGHTDGSEAQPEEEEEQMEDIKAEDTNETSAANGTEVAESKVTAIKSEGTETKATVEDSKGVADDNVPESLVMTEDDI